MRRSFWFSLAVWLPALALAHHGGAEYDLRTTVEFKGKLTGVDMINPHAWLYFDVTGADGKVSHHRCEMRSVHVLRRSGWTKELFPVGQPVTIEASPNRTDPAADDCHGQRHPHGPLRAIHQGPAGRSSGSARSDRRAQNQSADAVADGRAEPGR
jgi:hypothetical protein